MDKKTRNRRENTQASLFNTSTTNTTRSLIPQRQEKVNRPKPVKNTESVQNFRFGPSSEKAVKKPYQRNSDKTIKPPDKTKKQNSNRFDRNSLSSSIVEARSPGAREECQLSYTNPNYTVGKRSITDNFVSEFPAFTRVDTKTINDLEKRVENLQSILLKKIEILKSRSPEKLHKEYKFIALINGAESKLLIKEDDITSFPSFILRNHTTAAKSLEDLNRKASEFFVACLLSFIDKIRDYQIEGRHIDCDEIYEVLKNEEQDYCNILQEWINELCYENDKTLTEMEKCQSETSHQEVQTETETEIERHKMLIDQEIQTEAESLQDISIKINDFNAKIDKLRLENYDLKDQLVGEKEKHNQEIESLHKKYNEKISDIMDAWKKEKCETNIQEEVLNREKKLNIDLSQQVADQRIRLNELIEQNEILLSQKQEDDNARGEWTRVQFEVQRLQKENLELQDLKSHFLKKLDQRYEQIDLQDKEIKLQKRTLKTQSEEIEKLIRQFDFKVKENRELKDSLEARNKLIDHLRNAVDIDQKKIRELELQHESRQKPTDAVGNEVRKTRDPKIKTCKTRTLYLSQVKGTKIGLPFTEDSKMTSYNTPFDKWFDAFEHKTDESSLHLSRTDRRMKKDTNEKKSIFEVQTFQEDISTESSLERGKTPKRNIRQNKRVRDIVVKKYEV